MVSLNNGRVYFHCGCCHAEISRKATSVDYLGRYKLPDGWAYFRVFHDYLFFCEKDQCQASLNKICESRSVVPYD